MGVGEQNTPICQRVEVRGIHLERRTVQLGGTPVIKIINGDEEDVRRVFSGFSRSQVRWPASAQNQQRAECRKDVFYLHDILKSAVGGNVICGNGCHTIDEPWKIVA